MPQGATGRTAQKATLLEANVHRSLHNLANFTNTFFQRLIRAAKKQPSLRRPKSTFHYTICINSIIVIILLPPKCRLI